MIPDTTELFPPRARTSDPDTSHTAAREVAPNLRRNLDAVLVVARALRTFTLDDLVLAYNGRDDLVRQSPSGIRSRCSELARLGYVEDTGDRVYLGNGRRPARVLRVVG